VRSSRSLERPAAGHADLSHVASVWLFIALAVGVPLVTLLGLREPLQLSILPATWPVVVYAGLRLSVLAGRGEPRLISLTFWLFVYVWLGIAPMVQAHTGFPWSGVYSVGDIGSAMVVVLLGLVAFDVGTRIPSHPGFLARGLFSRRVVTGRALILGVLAVLVSCYLVVRLGGVRTFLASRYDVYQSIRFFAGSEFLDRLQLLASLLVVPPFVAAYLLWWLWLRRGSQLAPQARIGLLVVLTSTVLVNLLVSNPVNSARYWVGTIALSLVFVTLRWRAGWSFGFWVVLLAAALLVVFPYADAFRNTVDVRNLAAAAGEPIASGGDYDAFQQLMNGRTYVDEHGYTFGRQLLGALTFWIPRQLWSGKPKPTGAFVAESVGYDFTNLSMPLWGEAYVDGGLLLVVLAFAGYGFVTQRLEGEFLRRGLDDERILSLLVPLLAAYQIILLRGALMSAVANLVPVLACLLLVTRAEPPPSGEGGGEAGALESTS
jgi:hypothetical protein